MTTVDVAADAAARWTIGRIAALVSLTVAASAFAFTNVMMSPQLPAIQKEFGRGPAFGGLAFNITLAVAGASIPLVVLAAGRIGNRNMILCLLVVYIGASLLIGLGHSAASLVIGRAFWGVIGTLVPCVYAMTRIVFQGRSAMQATAIISGLVGGAGGLGLLLVAWLAGDYRNVALTWWLGTGIVSLVLVAAFLPNDAPVPTVAANVRGIATTSLGVLLILLPLLYIRWVRDHPVFGVAGVVIGAALLLTSKTSREMLAPNPTVTAANVMNVLSIAGFFAIYIAVPPVVVNAQPMHWVDGTLAASAIILLFPSVGALIGSQLSGRLIRAGLTGLSSPRVVSLSGIVAAVGLVVAAIEPRDLTWLLIGLTLVGIGTGGAFNGIVEAVSRSGPVAARTGVIVAGRYIGGALGGALVALMLDSAHTPSRTIDVVVLTFLMLAGLQLIGTGVWSWRARQARAAARVNQGTPA